MPENSGKRRPAVSEEQIKARLKGELQPLIQSGQEFDFGNNLIVKAFKEGDSQQITELIAAIENVVKNVDPNAEEIQVVPLGESPSILEQLTHSVQVHLKIQQLDKQYGKLMGETSQEIKDLLKGEHGATDGDFKAREQIVALLRSAGGIGGINSDTQCPEGIDQGEFNVWKKDLLALKDRSQAADEAPKQDAPPVRRVIGQSIMAKMKAYKDSIQKGQEKFIEPKRFTYPEGERPNEEKDGSFAQRKAVIEDFYSDRQKNQSLEEAQASQLEGVEKVSVSELREKFEDLSVRQVKRSSSADAKDAARENFTQPKAGVQQGGTSGVSVKDMVEKLDKAIKSQAEGAPSTGTPEKINIGDREFEFSKMQAIAKRVEPPLNETRQAHNQSKLQSKQLAQKLAARNPKAPGDKQKSEFSISLGTAPAPKAEKVTGVIRLNFEHQAVQAAMGGQTFPEGVSDEVKQVLSQYSSVGGIPENTDLVKTSLVQDLSVAGVGSPEAMADGWLENAFSDSQPEIPAGAEAHKNSFGQVESLSSSNHPGEGQAEEMMKFMLEQHYDQPLNLTITDDATLNGVLKAIAAHDGPVKLGDIKGIDAGLAADLKENPQEVAKREMDQNPSVNLASP